MLWQRTGTCVRPKTWIFGFDLRKKTLKGYCVRSYFGAPAGNLTVDDLTRKDTIFQIDVPPLRIDIITAIDGVEFEDAWPDRFETVFGGIPAFVISRQHLITNKKSSARLQDLADVQQLEAVKDPG